MNTAYEFIELDGSLSKEEKRRQILVQGTIARIAADDLTLSLVAHTLSLVEKFFGKPPREGAATLSKDDRASFLRRLTEAKAMLAQDPETRKFVCRIAAKHLNDASWTSYDQPRLRVVPATIKTPDAASKTISPSHSCHRDTWYANSQSQINFWLPMHDVVPSETFRFYSQYFNQALPNTSDCFNYADWSKKIGFGNSEKRADAFYPQTAGKGPESSEGQSFTLQKGDLIVFAAAHLHQTVEHSQELARISLDFRTVQEGDRQKGLTAPNQDNFSQGDAGVDYLKMQI